MPLATDATSARAREGSAGPLVLIGGGCTPNGEALGRFIDLSRARDGGSIVGFTTASADPAGSAELWRKDFRTAGVASAELPIVATRDHAKDPAIVQLVERATGIFLGGGDQVQLVTVVSGTPLCAAIKEAHARGAVVCGTSAGAAALTETTMAGGEIDEEGNLVDMHIGPGLGLLGYHTMIDTHFFERRRLHRLFIAIAGVPELMGLGIDEDTALVVRGHLGEVVGKGGVTYVDGRTITFDNQRDAQLGRQRTLSHMRVGIVGTGYHLDLRTREIYESERTEAPY